MDKNIIDKFDYENEIPDNNGNKPVKKGIKPIKPSQIYFEQLLCLFALAVIGFWNSGPRVAVMAGVSLLGAVLMDMLGCALSKKIYNPRDLSTLTAAMCIALLMPAGVNYAMAFFGSALTIGIKHIFGGKDNYIFNPTATAFAFLIICYPNNMLSFPRPHEHLPVFGEISPALLTGVTSPHEIETFDILMGYFAGAMGTVHILVLLVCGVCLLFRRSMSPVVTGSVLAATLLFSGVFSAEEGVVRASLNVLVSGYFLFILIFLANDPQTLPKTYLGKIYYGLGYGVLVVLFRVYGRVEGSPAFALLLVNTMSERSDIAAKKTIGSIKYAAVFVQNRLNSYERIREKAKTGDEAKVRPALSDTQEIVIVQQDYNMPPIDNKIIKINRKKQGVISKLREKMGNAAEKRRLKKIERAEKKAKARINIKENLVDGVKELGSVFKRKEDVPVIVEAPEPETLTPLELSLIIDDDDVVEIGVPEEDDEEDIVIIDESVGDDAHIVPPESESSESEPVPEEVAHGKE
ncbi:MAG: RnfABCDGE type electron transport complex subunit D [Oscillospiraceae bacterium]|nr:RnfABCDGE type electron transport complex subunit D [Oscillospiraceae bacterium]